MDTKQQQAEALKLIGDFSKWMTTISSAIIAVIGSLYKNLNSTHEVLGLGLTILFSIISIVFVSITLISLPAAIQDIKEHEKIWDRPSTVGFIKAPIRVIVGLQFISFILSILTFAISTFLLIVK